MRRPVTLAAVALVHLLGAGVVVGGGGAPVAAVVTPALAVRAIALPAPPPRAAPAPTLVAIPVELAAPAVEIAAEAAADCAIVERLTRAVADDPAASRAVAAGPHAATMLWDGQWRDPDPALHAAIVAALVATPAACREVPVTGPRLVIVAADGSTTALAIGSGTWTWNALLEEKTG